ncbi:MAG: hypothetical protein JW704_09405, partial [Anaerolineaceae bacterium]|nr:hypothetical protein [Anaerolineaceae bacterium]
MNRANLNSRSTGVGAQSTQVLHLHPIGVQEQRGRQTEAEGRRSISNDIWPAGNRCAYRAP